MPDLDESALDEDLGLKSSLYPFSKAIPFGTPLVSMPGDFGVGFSTAFDAGTETDINWSGDGGTKDVVSADINDFGIGGCDGNTTTGFPTVGTFRKLRQIASIVNLIPDAGDFGSPWPAQIERYRVEECFDLHVGLDGCLNSPVDHVTVTPVNCRPFETTVEKDIRCGFSGGIGGRRDSVLEALGSRCEIRIRDSIFGDYYDHVHFLQRCHIILNTAWTGSGQYYHVKGRVLEAGWARSALLEQIYSPIRDWFPSDSYFSYADTDEAIRIIETTSDDDIEERAMRLARAVRENYHPREIYQGILNKLGVRYTL